MRPTAIAMKGMSTMSIIIMRATSTITTTKKVA